MKLSPHFSLDEFTFSEYASRHFLSNNPSPEILENLKLTALKMEEVRLIVGKSIIVTSGYRSSEVNKGVGGAAPSSHVLGLACDFYPLGQRHKLLSVAKLIALNLSVFDQLILEYNWLHVGIGPKMRRELLTIRPGEPAIKGLSN